MSFKEIEEILKKTEGEVFEKATLNSLWKLMSKGYIKSFDFPISTGKEGNVFRAFQKDKFIAVKIYRITTSTFRNISKYLIYDMPNVRRDKRNIIFAWAQKEFNNLKKLHNAGIRVPKPIAAEGNVIVMEYIGSRRAPAPLLKNAAIKDAKKIFDKIAKYLRIMYCKAKLVHADFSEYNILIYRNQPVIIDVGQMVGRDNPIAIELLQRDIKNIVKFFKKFINVNEKKLFEYVKGGENEIRKSS